MWRSPGIGNPSRSLPLGIRPPISINWHGRWVATRPSARPSASSSMTIVSSASGESALKWKIGGCHELPPVHNAVATPLPKGTPPRPRPIVTMLPPQQSASRRIKRAVRDITTPNQTRFRRTTCRLPTQRNKATNLSRLPLRETSGQLRKPRRSHGREAISAAQRLVSIKPRNAIRGAYAPHVTPLSGSRIHSRPRPTNNICRSIRPPECAPRMTPRTRSPQRKRKPPICASLGWAMTGRRMIAAERTIAGAAAEAAERDEGPGGRAPFWQIEDQPGRTPLFRKMPFSRLMPGWK
jgi:hypothetical protein